MTMQDTIRDKLTQAFQPLALTVDDDSHRHAGHAGARPGGETHFRV
jgi:BolA protein